jgi:alanine transaminase
MEDLALNYKKAYDQGKKIKAIVVINPGNPTGQVMTKSNLEDVKLS